jgi:glutamyl-tRNA synthetase
VSPSIDHTVYLVGRDRAIKRIDDALARAGA